MHWLYNILTRCHWNIENFTKCSHGTRYEKPLHLRPALWATSSQVVTVRDAINTSWNSPQTQHVPHDVSLILSDESLKASELLTALNHRFTHGCTPLSLPADEAVAFKWHADVHEAIILVYLSISELNLNKCKIESTWIKMKLSLNPCLCKLIHEVSKANGFEVFNCFNTAVKLIRHG